MKKLTLLTFVLLSSVLTTGIKAQNLQLFYDPGRGCATSTIEMFRPDNGGSTYFFADMNYSPKVSTAYWEISREFNFWQDTKMGWLYANFIDRGFHVRPAVGAKYTF